MLSFYQKQVPMFVNLYNLLREEDNVFSEQQALLSACKNYKYNEEIFIAHCCAAVSNIPGDHSVDEWMDTHDLIIGDRARDSYISLSPIYRSLEARGEKMKAYKIIAPLEMLRQSL